MDARRQEVNNILRKINEPNTTADEFASISLPPLPSQLQYYQGTAEIIKGRGGAGNALDKLKAQALVDGVDISQEQGTQTLNVFFGGAL